MPFLFALYVELDMQNPVAVLPCSDLRRTTPAAPPRLRCRAHRTPDRHTECLQHPTRDCSLVTFINVQKYSLQQQEMFEPFPAKAPLCVIRLRRPRKVYTIDDAICSLLEVIDALKNHSQALEQEGKLCNMTSAAKKSKIRQGGEVFVDKPEAVVPRRD
jgi:hypothetical protein